MPLIRPFPGLRPLPGKAAEVAAPPYDVLDSNEARERAKGKPWSFLHISKPEIVSRRIPILQRRGLARARRTSAHARKGC
jgi:uncharacterized protein (DUF1015 family)